MDGTVKTVFDENVDRTKPPPGYSEADSKSKPGTKVYVNKATRA